ncbi:DUF4132 domain-containing protein [Streptosporangium sp. KLBMP 9127]|nr:DUF4132 domain-containing protein [Streptosporangium sp. KLBMP 9127]
MSGYADADTGLTWVPATPGHELALDGDTLVCRDDGGRRLNTVPGAVRRSAVAQELLALRDHLERHARECHAAVEAWMLGAQSVPAALIRQVWADPAWRDRLSGLVVIPEPAGRPRLLRRPADLAGAERALIPHPLLLADLAELRRLAADLGVTQQVPQLSREIHTRPPGAAGRNVTDYAGAYFAELGHAADRARSLGFEPRGGYAVCRVADRARPVQARYWLGACALDAETWTGELAWVGPDEHPIDIQDVGPVAWSEGIRMAQLIHAGRVAEED